MERRRRIAVIGAGVVAAIGLTAGVGLAAGAVDVDDDQPLTGETYDAAVAAALEHTGEGEVTETEVGDDGAAYEVEVRLADGSQVEVQLDESFTVLGSEPDDDGVDGADGDD